ncbi:hypothetical protein [Leuconostoc mesenteroides]
MTKYQKKPVTVEAFQWTKEKIPEWFRILGYRTYGNNIDIGDDSRNIVYPGDYIICDEDGEIYSCKPDIFEETYVNVNDTNRISPDDIGNDIHEFLHGGDK